VSVSVFGVVWFVVWCGVMSVSVFGVYVWCGMVCGVVWCGTCVSWCVCGLVCRCLLLDAFSLF
jgi:hypothetical protein